MALTQQEASVLATVADVVNEAMAWQKDWEKYSDEGNVCLSLEKEEKAALTRAIRKLMEHEY